MRILTGLSGFLLVLAVALAGCGGDDADKEPKDTSASSSAAATSPAANVDVCKLLTPGDVAAAFGGPFGDGALSHQENTGADQCVWTSTDATPAKTFSLSAVGPAGLGDTLKANGVSVAEAFEQTKAAYPNAEAMDLGDEAYAAVSEVQVLDGDTWYSFTAYLGAGVDALGGLKKLAAQVVG